MNNARKIYLANKDARPRAFNIGEAKTKIWANQYFTCYQFLDGSKYAVGFEHRRNLLKLGYLFAHRYYDKSGRIMAVGSF